MRNQASVRARFYPTDSTRRNRTRGLHRRRMAFEQLELRSMMAAFDVLVFSRTTGFRHDSIDEGIAAIQALGAANDFTVTATEDPAAMNDANLAQYEVLVFLSRPATSSTPRSRARSSATSTTAEAGSASTRPPTPNTTGRSTAGWSARTSKATRRSNRPRSRSPTRCIPRRNICRIAGFAPTSGTTFERTRGRTCTC